MRELTLGTIFSVIYAYKKRTLFEKDIFTHLFPKTTEENNGNISSIKSSNRPLSIGDIEYIDKISEDSLSLQIKEILDNDIKEDSQKDVIGFLIQSVLDDGSLIGDFPDFKLLASKKIKVCGYRFIAQLMKFVIHKDNKNPNAIILKKSKDLHLSFDINNLILEEDKIINIPTSLEPSIADLDIFSSVNSFHENEYALKISNSQLFNVYLLKYDDFKFNDDNLVDFISTNLTNYTFSRTRLNEDASRDLSLKALRALKLKDKDTKIKIFSDVLLYSFMEYVLHSPKLYSGFELGHDLNTHNVSGVYFMPAGTIDSHNQLVFGSSNVKSSLDDAFKSVLKTCEEIVTDKTNIRKRIDSAIIYKNHFNDKEKEFLKSVLIPSKTNKTDVISSFSVFFSYSIDTSSISESNLDAYRKKLEDEIHYEINNIIPSIENYINGSALKGYSFYFFILPLDNAENDAIRIINKIKGDDYE